MPDQLSIAGPHTPVMSEQHFRVLINKYIQGTITPAEWKELTALLHAGNYQHDLEELIDAELANGSRENFPDQQVAERIFQRMKREMQTPAARLTSMNTWKKWLLAAVVTGVMITGTIIYSARLKTDHIQTPNVASVAHKTDVAAPVVSKAVITLSGGKQIFLDQAGKGLLASEGQATLVKDKNGVIVYAVDTKEALHNDVNTFNTITVPRGNPVVALSLSDGTAVWLNAGSTMRYPTVFTGNERRVQISGEVYFEVAKDKSKKFFTETSAAVVEVYGTHFNIRSHDDEPVSRITLLEGSVQVSGKNNRQTLRPGEQATVYGNGVKNIGMVDTEQVIAWKEGRFQFEGADIKQVMGEISRWYDLDAVYEGALVEQHFSGTISRTVQASKVLKMLEATDAVHFSIEDKKITVRH